MVDVVFADVAQPDQARIVGLNSQYFLKNGGNFVISIKASCIDSTAPPEAVFAREVRPLRPRILSFDLCWNSQPAGDDVTPWPEHAFPFIRLPSSLNSSSQPSGQEASGDAAQAQGAGHARAL